MALPERMRLKYTPRFHAACIECKSQRMPPLLPEDFERALDSKSFTSRNADLEFVGRMYRHGVTGMVVGTRGWPCGGR